MIGKQVGVHFWHRQGGRFEENLLKLRRSNMAGDSREFGTDRHRISRDLFLYFFIQYRTENSMQTPRVSDLENSF
jgi:hypothetical protein